MKIKDIRKDSIVKTKLGFGQVLRVGGTFPVTVKVRIFFPFPRGDQSLVPRDIEREVSAEELQAMRAALDKAHGGA